MFTLFNDAVNASASYYIIMHYRQPQSLSKKVEQLSITYYERLNISVPFHYCPTDHGCRVVIGEEENLTFRFSKGTFTAIIQHERRTHLVRKSKFDIFHIFTCILPSTGQSIPVGLIVLFIEHCTGIAVFMVFESCSGVIQGVISTTAQLCT